MPHTLPAAPWDTALCGLLLNTVPGDEAVRPGVHDGFENDAEDEEEARGERGTQGDEVEACGNGVEAEGGAEGAGEGGGDGGGKEELVEGGLGPKKKRGGHGMVNSPKSQLVANYTM